jgi:hypothetical protein
MVHVEGNQSMCFSHIDIFLCLSLFSTLSKNQWKISLDEDLKIKSNYQHCKPFQWMSLQFVLNTQEACVLAYLLIFSVFSTPSLCICLFFTF